MQRPIPRKAVGSYWPWVLAAIALLLSLDIVTYFLAEGLWFSIRQIYRGLLVTAADPGNSGYSRLSRQLSIYRNKSMASTAAKF